MAESKRSRGQRQEVVGTEYKSPTLLLLTERESYLTWLSAHIYI